MTDIVGSTEKAAAMGDLRWKDLLHVHDGIVRREVKSYGGREINTTGDGFVLAFTGPTRAIQCATAISQELSRLGLVTRTGLHTGECERREDDLSGLAVHIAARISSNAPPNSILASRPVGDLVVGSGIRFTDQRIYSLKGVPGEWPLFAVVQLAASSEPSESTSGHEWTYTSSEANYRSRGVGPSSHGSLAVRLGL